MRKTLRIAFPGRNLPRFTTTCTMNLFIELNGKHHAIDTNRFHDLSLPVEHDGKLNAYYIDNPEFKPYQAGSFIGSVQEGGSVNCFDVRFNPHGNCTHTESLGHISPERLSVNSVLKDFFHMCQLLTVDPILFENGDLVIEEDQVLPFLEKDISALALRTLPNSDAKRQKRYSGTNPTYMHHTLANSLAGIGIKHLLVDLPSIDREEDEGRLLAHHAFWTFPDNPRTDATITEFIFAGNEVPDGLYLLNLQVAAFELDASPSRPVLYPFT